VAALLEASQNQDCDIQVFFGSISQLHTRILREQFRRNVIKIISINNINEQQHAFLQTRFTYIRLTILT
jgi:hypothetical protein